MATSERNVVLHVDDVSRNFGGLHALSDIDFTVEEGTTHAIIGPNGAGKSTLLNVIIGRIPPTRGAVVFDGQVLTGKRPYEINQMGVARVFQTPEIFADLPVLQNVMMPAFARRDGAFRINIMTSVDGETAIRDEAEAILEDVGLSARRFVHAGALSRGDKRRMELAMCLIQHPRLLLLDEPTAGMSRHDTNTTIELLQKIKASGMTKVIIEHDMHVVFSLADKISVLSGGRIIAEGLPDDVRGNAKVQEAYLGGAHRLEEATH
jgi:branched-chain amino acid transport system ATP-binding protein